MHKFIRTMTLYCLILVVWLGVWLICLALSGQMVLPWTR